MIESVGYWLLFVKFLLFSEFGRQKLSTRVDIRLTSVANQHVRQLYDGVVLPVTTLP